MRVQKQLDRWRLRRLSGAASRWLRRRGFGVHSPFAFDFINRVIAPRNRYYCYERLEAVARRSGLRPSDMRLLFRLSLFFRPATCGIVGSGADGILEAIVEGAPDAAALGPDPQADMLIVNGPVGEETLMSTIARRGVIVVLGLRSNPEVLPLIWRRTDRGMIFRGSSTAVFVGRRQLPHQVFTLWI